MSHRHGVRRSPSTARAGRIWRGSAGAARFARCRRRATDCASWQVALLDALGVHDYAEYPSAAVTRTGDAAERARDFWLHLQPMHFMAGLDRLTAVMLHGASSVAARGTGGAGADRSARTCEPRGCSWSRRREATGSYIVERALDVQTAPPEIAAASALEQAMPQGRDAPALRRLMTELQMLLHEHPVNVERARRGLPEINAVWFHGAGEIRDAAALRSAAGFRRRPVPARDLSIERQST